MNQEEFSIFHEECSAGFKASLDRPEQKMRKI